MLGILVSLNNRIKNEKFVLHQNLLHLHVNIYLCKKSIESLLGVVLRLLLCSTLRWLEEMETRTALRTTEIFYYYSYHLKYKHSGDLKSGHVPISNGQPLFSFGMVMTSISVVPTSLKTNHLKNGGQLVFTHW